MQVLYRRGIFLPGPDLWLDPHQSQASAVVTHGHADHIRQHERVYSTIATAAMMRVRGVTRCEFKTLAFGKPTQMGEAQVTLYPAGHILGSAQVLVEWRESRLLYSGDFKLRPCRSAEATEVPEADVVIMETTFGRPRYRFPETAEVEDRIRAFCRSTLDENCIPVLFCYSLGKGQEILACLEGADFPIYLHSAHWKMANLYRDMGVKLPPFQPYQPGQKLDGVLLCAAGCRRGLWFHKLGPVRTAYISGWAVDAGARWRFRTDAAFPLSDHADYDDLLEYVRRTGAKTVHTVHGFADEFSRDLRRLGYWSEPLREPGLQLSLF
jgi:Cft2 family RNA processing exonuclease